MATIEERVREILEGSLPHTVATVRIEYLLAKSLDALEKRVEERASGLYARLDVHRDKFRAIESVLDAMGERIGKLEERVSGALDRAVRLLQEPEGDEPSSDDHDWGIDSYRCLRCGCNRDNAPDQPCKPKPAEPLSLKRVVFEASRKAWLANQDTDEAVILAVAEWVHEEGWHSAARDLRAQLEP